MSRGWLDEDAFDEPTSRRRKALPMVIGVVAVAAIGVISPHRAEAARKRIR